MNSLLQGKRQLGDGSVEADIEVFFAVELDGRRIHQAIWVFGEGQKRLIEDGDFGISKSLGTRLDEVDLAAEETEECALVRLEEVVHRQAQRLSFQRFFNQDGHGVITTSGLVRWRRRRAEERAAIGEHRCTQSKKVGLDKDDSSKWNNLQKRLRLSMV